jgi:hypothetical protein
MLSIEWCPFSFKRMVPVLVQRARTALGRLNPLST